MYPDLKDFRKELNSVGPWLFRSAETSLLYFICIFSTLFIIQTIDSETGNKFPWFIEYSFMFSLVFQSIYFFDNWKLGIKKRN